MQNIDERNDFYYDHRDIIHLTNQTELIINYPGGDRFGDLYAEPYTDISFLSFKLSGNNDLDDNLYLFLNDKYNEGNKILDYLNEFSSNANFSIKRKTVFKSVSISLYPSLIHGLKPSIPKLIWLF